jgi:hypothetical protein
MDADKKLSEQESLQLITSMIQQARAGYFHDSGTGAILWGSVVGFAGLMSFFDAWLGWDTGFDWWLLALFALLPQFYISWRESKAKTIKTDIGRTLDIVWVVFGISIFAVILYLNVAPDSASGFLEADGKTLLQKDMATGEISPYRFGVAPSSGSLLLLLYALPTMVTGVSKKFWPLIAGAIITYAFFIVSLYTRTYIDNLLMGLAGLINWLIPGIMLRSRYLKAINRKNV